MSINIYIGTYQPDTKQFWRYLNYLPIRWEIKQFLKHSLFPRKMCASTSKIGTILQWFKIWTVPQVVLVRILSRWCKRSRLKSLKQFYWNNTTSRAWAVQLAGLIGNCLYKHLHLRRNQLDRWKFVKHFKIIK